MHQISQHPVLAHAWDHAEHPHPHLQTLIKSKLPVNGLNHHVSAPSQTFTQLLQVGVEVPRVVPHARSSGKGGADRLGPAEGLLPLLAFLEDPDETVVAAGDEALWELLLSPALVSESSALPLLLPRVPAAPKPAHVVVFFSGRPSLVHMHESAGASSHSTQTT